MGTYVIEMVQTPTATPSSASQPSQTFDVLNLTIGCIITSVANFATVSQADATYNLYQPALLINMATYNAGNLVQTPDCGYNLNPTYTFTFPSPANNFIVQNADLPSQIKIQTNNPSYVSNTAYTVTMNCALTDSSSKAYVNGGTDVSFSKTGVTINVTIADPCTATTIKKVNSTASTDPGMGAKTVQDGASLTIDFTKALDTVELAQGLNTLCGARTYRLCYAADCSTVTGKTDVSWATAITTKAGVADTFTFTLTPDSLYPDGPAITVGSNTLYLRTILNNYNTVAANVETITVTVTAAACDCDKARWTMPSAPNTLRVNVSLTNTYTLPTLTVVAASVNSANNVADADTIKMRSCQGSSFCAFTHTYVMRL